MVMSSGISRPSDDNAWIESSPWTVPSELVADIV